MDKRDWKSVETKQDKKGNIIKKTRTVIYHPDINNIISYLKKVEGKIEKIDIIEVNKIGQKSNKNTINSHKNTILRV